MTFFSAFLCYMEFSDADTAKVADTHYGGETLNRTFSFFICGKLA